MDDDDRKPFKDKVFGLMQENMEHELGRPIASAPEYLASAGALAQERLITFVHAWKEEFGLEPVEQFSLLITTAGCVLGDCPPEAREAFLGAVERILRAQVEALTKTYAALDAEKAALQ